MVESGDSTYNEFLMQAASTITHTHETTPQTPRLGLRYLHGFGAAIKGRHWLTRIAWLGLGILVPVVGPIVIEGYRFDALEAFIRGRASTFPPVEPKRFTEYLMRGFWVFLPMLILQFVIGPILAVAFQSFAFAVVLLVAALTNAGTITPEEIASIVSVGIAMLFVIITAATLCMKLLITPIQLRAGLTQDLAKTVDIAWIRDFLKRVWLETLVAEVFFFVSTLALMPFGALVFLVGLYVVVAVSMLAHTHLLGQLYLLYLKRGGEPIPMKEPSPLALANWADN